MIALERYTALRPKDQGALAELASQYGTLATTYSNDYAAAQQSMAEQESPASAFGPASTTPFGKALASRGSAQGPDLGRGRDARRRRSSRPPTPKYQNAQRNAESAYRKLVVLNPSDATSQIQLGQAAQAAQDPATAIAAFKAFLKLAPTDPLGGAGEGGAEGAPGPGGCQRLEQRPPVRLTRQLPATDASRGTR